MTTKWYMVYCCNEVNDYIAVCPDFTTEQEAREAAKRLTMSADYPEVLSVGVVEENEDGEALHSWQRIGLYCCGQERFPQSEAKVVIEVDGGVASVDKCPDWIEVEINDLDMDVFEDEDWLVFDDDEDENDWEAG